jgi:hypothetical protein
VVVVILYLTGVVNDFGPQELVSFLICAFVIGIGLSLFNSGAEQSVSRIGQVVGEGLFKHKKMWLVLLVTFLLGIVVTIAEPDLKVMAGQIGMNEWLLILCISLGVGVFMVVGVLRVILQKPLNIYFVCFYGLVFALASIVNPKFLPICFDSGGVTTGPITVPFIIAFGAGLAASRSSNGSSSADSFGLTALASVGPIIMMLILSLFLDPESLVFDPASLEAEIDFSSWDAFWGSFPVVYGYEILSQLSSVGLAIVPILCFFIVYNLIFIKMPWKSILKIFIGLFYLYFGLVMFLGSVETGFLPVARQVGMSLGSDPNLFPLAVTIGALFGLFGVLAEPAVHVLVDQIEVISEGTIKSRTVLAVMALAIAGGVALAVVRAYYDFSILYYVVPGYILACGLTFFVPKVYYSIAFDSGGVASGPMASTFIMPFCIGFTYAAKGAEYVYADAFGCIAMIAMMPLIVIQLLGAYVEIKRSVIMAKTRKKFAEPDDDEIVYFGEI